MTHPVPGGRRGIIAELLLRAVRPVIGRLDVVAPFNDDRLRTAIYTLDFTADEAALGCEVHGFLHCDCDLLNTALAGQCQVDDPWGVIKAGVVESQYAARGGEIICLGINHSDEVSYYVRCVWDDEAPFEYFDSQCAPWWGTEDIGRDKTFSGQGLVAAHTQPAQRPNM